MNKIALNILRLMPWVFGLGLVLTTTLSLLPSTSIPETFVFWDKAQHGLAFTALTITGCIAFPKKLTWVCFGLLFHGALIELMQSTLTTTRFGDSLDWFADGVGIVLGVLVYILLNKARDIFSPGG